MTLFLHTEYIKNGLSPSKEKTSVYIQTRLIL